MLLLFLNCHIALGIQRPPHQAPTPSSFIDVCTTAILLLVRSVAVVFTTECAHPRASEWKTAWFSFIFVRRQIRLAHTWCTRASRLAKMQFFRAGDSLTLCGVAMDSLAETCNTLVGIRNTWFESLMRRNSIPFLFQKRNKFAAFEG